MTMLSDGFEALAPRDDDEGLFSRDFNGELIRLDKPTEDDYAEVVKLKIDGMPVEVRKAEPLKDAQGNIILDFKDKTTPRYTTIYDAALKLRDEGKIVGELPIPVLCHQQHMTPVAVCRMCVVQVFDPAENKLERRLTPACQRQVKNGMEVFTMNAPGPNGDRVSKSVSLLTDLLVANHLKPAPLPEIEQKLGDYNELKQMKQRIQKHMDGRFPPQAGGASDQTASRFKLDVLCHGSKPVPMAQPPVGRWLLDGSSPVFMVDHSACILCDRCARACDEVKENNVIGRTGKGASAGIGFDLNDVMRKSSCVQCGECMVSCPTSAITFRPQTTSKIKIRAGGSARVLSTKELLEDDLFKEIPVKFLLWQEGLVVQRTLKANDTLCEQNDPGNTAFLIKSGKLRVTVSAPGAKKESGGLPGLFGPKNPKSGPFLVDKQLEPKDVIVGEMACLSGAPRTATITALTDGEVWEIRRNVLDRLMRSPKQNEKFDEIYRKRALAGALLNAEFSRGLDRAEVEKCAEFLQNRLSFVRFNPKQVIFRQGEYSDGSIDGTTEGPTGGMFLTRLGHVRVDIDQPTRAPAVVFLGPGSVIGEIGALALSPDDVKGIAEADIPRKVLELDRNFAEALENAPPQDRRSAIPAGQRTATCSALDHLELARLDRKSIAELLHRFPNLRRKLIEVSLRRLRGQLDDRPLVAEFVEQGLYQGQSLLVLDLDSCTRCDECTRACVNQHGTESHGQPITRLLREGLRFGNNLVATSCRSCKDAYCMVGCPVDSIHRGKHLQIVIENHCIGCGLCEQNCPYGNISMAPNLNDMLKIPDPNEVGGFVEIARRKASTCDLCDAEGELDEPKPRCVYACPHDSAHRMTGEELLKRVEAQVASEA